MTWRANGLTLGKLIQAVESSPTLVITDLATTLKAEGRDLISFAAGQPDFDTPQNIKDAAKRALDEGKTKYEPVAGVRPLREAIARRYRGKGLDVSYENVVVSCGAKHSLYELTQVLLNRDDEVIIPAPYWVSYPAQVTLTQAKPVIVPTTAATGFKITADMFRDAIGPKTRFLFLNSPNNPTGAVYTRQELMSLAEVVLEHNLGTICDSIYDELVYDDLEFVEFAALHPDLPALTVTVNGLSKSHAMTGWRIGYFVAPQHVASAVSKLQSQCTSAVTSIAQWAAVEALEGSQESVSVMKQHFDARRKLMVRSLREIDGVECSLPQGAFYAFPDLGTYLGRTGPDGVIDNDIQLAAYLLRHHGVAVVPGSAFGAPGFLRLSYTISEADIQRGVARIRSGLSALS